VGSSGVGALTAALYLASRKSVLGLGRLISAAVIVFGSALVLFSLSKLLLLSMALMILAGSAMMIILAACNTVLQTIVEDKNRGRVMSLYAMAFMGMAPFGSLLGGAIAHRIGASFTLLLGGFCCIASGLLFTAKLPMLRELVRPIYIKKGILHETSKGLQAAAELNTPPGR
jgi:MFS family permease